MLRPQSLRGPVIRALIVAAAALTVGALVGCGEDPEPSPATGAAGLPGQGGKLVWALSQEPRGIDPLLARTRAEQLVSRQIHEPLVEQLAGPFGDVRRRPGLARKPLPSPDRTIWRLNLRNGISFQDGAPFDARAVLANAARWQALEEGREILPHLLAVDAPAPDIVQFILSRPDRNLPERLASPRLGIVSPRALSAHRGGGARLMWASLTGTGPFELREREASRVLIARNVEWWGTPRDLGPALDQVEFRVVPAATERLALLHDGEVQVAEDLRRSELAAVRRDPLLSALGRSGPGIGLERSVRGIPSAAAIPSLSGAWRTTIGAG